MIPPFVSRVLRVVGPICTSAALIGFIAAATGSCASEPDPTRYTIVFQPDFDTFAGQGEALGVRVFLEKRCGTLDCHGQPGRPYTVFHRDGLRLVNDDTSAVTADPKSPTSPEEILAHFQSITSVEPELISRVIADPVAYPVTTLTIYRKGLGMERHKGGQVIAAGEAADKCVSSWLLGQTDTAACTAAAQVP